MKLSYYDRIFFMQITSKLLRRLCPTAKQDIIEDIADYFNKHASAYDITTENRICHFFAQAAHESAHFQTLTEYADGSAYEGRTDLGNIQPGDGKRYKGRGIFQLTGRSNYRLFGKRIGLDLENNPALAQHPEVSVLTALEYWKDRNLNKYADNDDINSITAKINGGYNGLDDRKNYLQSMKKLIHEDLDIIKKGDIGPEVKQVQQMLIYHGYKLTADGIFGSGTESVVKQFQSSKNILVSGMVDKNTFDLLKKT